MPLRVPMPADRKSPLSPMSQPMDASALHGDRGGACALASDARRVDAQTISAARQLNDNFMVRLSSKTFLSRRAVRLRSGLGARGLTERFHGDRLVAHFDDL